MKNRNRVRRHTGMRARKRDNIRPVKPGDQIPCVMLTLSSSDDSKKVNGFVLTLLGTCENAVPAGTTVLFIELDEEKYPTNTIAQTAAEAGQFTMNLAEPVNCPTGQKRHFVFKIEIPLDSKHGWHSSGTIGLSLKEIVTDGTLVIGTFPKNSPLYNLRDGSVVQLVPERPPHVPTTAGRR